MNSGSQCCLLCQGLCQPSRRDSYSLTRPTAASWVSRRGSIGGANLQTGPGWTECALHASASVYELTLNRRRVTGVCHDPEGKYETDDSVLHIRRRVESTGRTFTRKTVDEPLCNLPNEQLTTCLQCRVVYMNRNGDTTSKSTSTHWSSYRKRGSYFIHVDCQCPFLTMMLCWETPEEKNTTIE